jgi:capsular polysaccharide biosynthesis protein
MRGAGRLAKLFPGRTTPAGLPSSVRYAPPLSLDRLSREDIWRPGAPGVFVEPPDAVRHTTRPGPVFHDDPDGCGLLADAGPLTLQSPPNFVIRASGAVQIGTRSYVMPDGRWFGDDAYVQDGEFDRYAAYIMAGDAFQNEHIGISAGEAAGTFRLADCDRPLRRLDGTVVSLCALEGGNYGASLFRIIPKLASIAAWPKDCTVLAPFLPRSLLDLLAMAGVPMGRFVMQRPGFAYAMEHAVIPSMRTMHGLLDAPARAIFADLRRRFGAPPAGRRIYVSRRGFVTGSGRPILNETEVVERLAAIGFEEIRPHTMSMRQQIQCFSSASVVVGAAGSAMFNAVFCHPGALVVDIESEPHWLFAHMNLFGSCGVDYAIFEARAADTDWSRHHKPLTVNAAALADRLKGL